MHPDRPGADIITDTAELRLRAAKFGAPRRTGCGCG